MDLMLNLAFLALKWSFSRGPLGPFGIRTSWSKSIRVPKIMKSILKRWFLEKFLLKFNNYIFLIFRIWPWNKIYLWSVLLRISICKISGSTYSLNSHNQKSFGRINRKIPVWAMWNRFWLQKWKSNDETLFWSPWNNSPKVWEYTQIFLWSLSKTAY